VRRLNTDMEGWKAGKEIKKHEKIRRAKEAEPNRKKRMKKEPETGF
jgi:hypothetical protein